MENNWQEYVKICHDLVVESEKATNKALPHQIEAYVVHLMARSFNRTDIGIDPMAIKLLNAINAGIRQDLLAAADECLLIHSFPLRRTRWPSNTYYQDMGMTAYGLAGHMMESHFVGASKILSFVFNRKFDSEGIQLKF